MRHIRWNYQNFPGVHDDIFPLQGEFQCTFQDVSDLFILMAMQWHDAPCSEYQSGKHALLTRDELSVKQRIQMFRGHVFKPNMLDV